jgi:DNA-binding PadR family transcriptional regulator
MGNAQPAEPAAAHANYPAGRRRSPGALRTAVLAALVEQPGHGYDLTNRLNRRMGAMLQVDLRRVYEVLEQLEKERLACSTEQHALSAPRRRRRVFSATERGHEVHAAWLREREPVPMVRADIYALVAFSRPEQGDALLTKLEEYELDCMQMQEQACEIDLGHASWRSRMFNVTRAAVGEQLRAEIRWITRVRREIEEYLAETR